MSLHFKCPKCNKRYRVLREQAGKPGRCRQCYAVLRVPRTLDDLKSDTIIDLLTATIDKHTGGLLGFLRKALGFQ